MTFITHGEPDCIRRVASSDRRGAWLVLHRSRPWSKSRTHMNERHSSDAAAAPSRRASNSVRVRRLGLDTQYEAIVFMHKDCQVCRSEGFSAHARVLLCNGKRRVIATLYQVDRRSDRRTTKPALSESAWARLGLQEGDSITVTHPAPLDSLSHRSQPHLWPRPQRAVVHAIIQDIVDGKYSDIHLSSFLTACAARALDHKGDSCADPCDGGSRRAAEVAGWHVVDKHCAGGLPGNRTTPIVVAIVASLGLMMPKTSSRAITSPAGTADTMETMAPVELDTAAIRRVVERESGCVVWGGAVKLSPADDILIRVERALDLDTEGQLIASVLSKKIAAGSTHLVIDLPVGPTAKLRSPRKPQRSCRGPWPGRRDVWAADQGGADRWIAAGRTRHWPGPGSARCAVGPAMRAECPAGFAGSIGCTCRCFA